MCFVDLSVGLRPAGEYFARLIVPDVHTFEFQVYIYKKSMRNRRGHIRRPLSKGRGGGGSSYLAVTECLGIHGLIRRTTPSLAALYDKYAKGVAHLFYSNPIN